MNVLKTENSRAAAAGHQETQEEQEEAHSRHFEVKAVSLHDLFIRF